MEIKNGFLEVPSSLNVTIGEQALFYCNHSTTQDIAWRINDTSLSVLNLPTITTRRIRLQDSPGDSFVHELAIQALMEYNQTSVQCLAYIGSSPEYSPEATVLIQGILDPVNNIQRNGSTVTWEPPFSLDLTNTDTDIVYCVEVNNITCGGRHLVFAHCNVADDTISCSCELSFIYEVLVTPRNNVDQAMNGTVSAIREQFKFIEDAMLHIRDICYCKGSLDLNTVVELPLTTKVSGSVQPSTYALLLTSVDGLHNQQIVHSSINSETEATTVLETNLTLPIRTLWDIGVLAYGCRENAITRGLELSTHDVQQILVISTPGGVNVSGNFAGRSTATGILMIVYTLTDLKSDIYYLFIPRSFGQQRASAVFECISSGTYNVSLFPVEEDSLPFSRVATKVRTISVDQGRNVDCLSTSHKIIFYLKLIPSDGSVCITCTFLESSMTDCVAVVHQRISQLSSSGLMNIVSSHKFNRSGNTAHGCIEGVNLTQNQVGVIGALLISTFASQTVPVKCGMGCIIASVVVGVSITTVIAGVLTSFLCFIWRRKRGNDVRGSSSDAPSVAVDIKMDQCAAYEIIGIGRQKVIMNENPAYEEIGRYANHQLTLAH